MYTQPTPMVHPRLRVHTGSNRRHVRCMWYALLCAGALLLSGCVHSGATTTVHRYDLGAAPSAVVDDRSAQHDTGKVLGMAQISAPRWLAGTAMYYRLAYRDDNRLAAYAYSKWTAPPAVLLAGIIRDTLATQGGWRAVVKAESAAAAAVTLHLRLTQFSQVFTQPQHSVGIVEMSATLAADHAERVVAQQRFRVQVAAPTADAEGGVQALGTASRELAARLQHWVQAQAADHSTGPHADG